MRKNFTVIKLLALCIMICLGACSTRSTTPPTPISSFIPAPGSFNVKTVLFQLKGNGNPEQVKVGALPIVQNAIQTLSGMGYEYQPYGEVDYLIEARIGSISPKAAAHRESQQVGFSKSLSYGSSFRNYPVVIKKWSPSIERVKNSPNACYLVVELLIKQEKGVNDTIYSGTPDPIEVPYELGCPFAQCGQGVNQGLTNYLQKLFTLPAK
ncbi:hypothetical protein [Maridesulfovibrio frigidus]|uniref:hypothetical protein n=1 Tax=Maridesulfovibrio frigidus TaxID=340956 RepID=UPI0004E1C605|nr:hypothetical protein [Maridesulfovibrio frigidus]